MRSTDACVARDFFEAHVPGLNRTGLEWISRLWHPSKRRRMPRAFDSMLQWASGGGSRVSVRTFRFFFLISLVAVILVAHVPVNRPPYLRTSMASALPASAAQVGATFYVSPSGNDRNP